MYGKYSSEENHLHKIIIHSLLFVYLTWAYGVKSTRVRGNITLSTPHRPAQRPLSVCGAVLSYRCCSIGPNSMLALLSVARCCLLLSSVSALQANRWSSHCCCGRRYINGSSAAQRAISSIVVLLTACGVNKNWLFAIFRDFYFVRSSLSLYWTRRDAFATEGWKLLCAHIFNELGAPWRQPASDLMSRYDVCCVCLNSSFRTSPCTKYDRWWPNC